LLENLLKAVDSEAASFFVADPKKETMTIRACIGPKKAMVEMIAEELPFPFGKGLCGWTAQYNQPLIVEDAQQDGRFNRQVDTLTGYKTKSVLCAPVSIQDEVLGVIEIINKKSAGFNKNDQDFVALICKQAAIALENAKLYGELRKSNTFMQSVLANLTGGLISVDDRESMTHINPAAEKILGIAASEAIGKPSDAVLGRYPAIRRELAEALKSRQRQPRGEMDCTRADGSAFKMGYSSFPIEDAQQRLWGAGITFRDLDALGVQIVQGGQSPK
jgi:adenylate cyclase